MAEGSKGDVVWLDVLPSMATFATTLAKGTAKAATDAGKTSGVAWAKSFSGSAGDAGTKSVLAELETAAKRTKRIVEDQTGAIGRARAAQKDAAAKVILAEQALTDARAKGDTAKAEAAELRLGAARDRLDSAAAKLVSAEDQLKAAHREHRIALVGAAFEWWRDTAVSAWETIRSGISSAWDWIDDNVFTPIKTGIDAVGRAFDATATWIGEAWERVKEAAAAPVRFVVNTIYRDGIKATWDRIADAVGLDLHLPTITLPFADGGIMPGYTPGRDVHRFYSPTGGLLELSGGEPILRPEAGRVLGTDWVHGINAAARTAGTAGVESFLGGESQGFADGGFWDQVGGVVSSIGQGVRGVVVNVARILADPVNAVRDMLTAPIDRLLSQVGGGVLGQLLVEYPRSVIEGIVTKARDLISGLTGGGGGEYTGAAGAWVRPAQGPITSEYGPRNGAFHAGIDIGGPGPTFAAAAGSVVRAGWGVLSGRTGLGILLSHGAGDYTYNGHNPVGGIKVNTGDVVAPGQRIGAKGSTGNATGDHLHFELHRGALGRTVNPRSAGVFDNGGYLPPGVSVVENWTGEPEPVLTGEQWDALANQAAVARIAGEDMDAFAERVARAVVAAASQEAGRQLSSVRRDYSSRSKTPGALR